MKRVLTICLLFMGFAACQKDANNPIVKPSNLIYTPGITTVNQGTAGVSIMPVVNDGGDKIRFSIISTAINGIDISNSTGMISWNSTVAAGVYDITIAATNLIGAATCNYKLIVNNGLNGTSTFSYTPSTILVNKGTAGSSGVPLIRSVGDPLSFQLTGIVPAGISINNSNGEISWNNSLPVGNYNLAATASNNLGSISSGFALSVLDPGYISTPSSFAYTPSSVIILKGFAGVSAIPSIVTGGSAITFSFSGAVPNGITINATTGEISWSNQVTEGIFVLTVKATNNSGSTTTNYSLRVNSFIQAPTDYMYTPSSVTTTIGRSGNSAVPTINDGLGTISYSLMGTIPAGISINGITGVISWTSSVAAGTYTINCKASNLGGSMTTIYTLTVN